MKESSYVFSANEDWLALVQACVPLDNHDDNPPYRILGALVSNLHTPQSIQDGTLVNDLKYAVPEGEHFDKIMNCAVTLYVNMINELNAMRIGNAKSYFLIDAKLHIQVGMFLAT